MQIVNTESKPCNLYQSSILFLFQALWNPKFVLATKDVLVKSLSSSR